MTASSIMRLRTWFAGAVAHRCVSCSGVLPAGRVDFCSAVCQDVLGRAVRDHHVAVPAPRTASEPMSVSPR